MHKTKHKPGGRTGVTEYHANRPILLQPVIARESTIDGVLFYHGKDGKLFVAELFDNMFKTSRTEIFGQHYKGSNPCKSKV